MDYHGKTNNFSITPSAVSLNITPIAAVNSNPTGSYFTDRYILQDKNLVETGSNGNSGNTNGTNAANLKFNNSNNMNVMGEYIKINQ